MRHRISLLVLICLPSLTWAEAVTSSARPKPRPVIEQVAASEAIPKPVPRPKIEIVSLGQKPLVRPRAKPVIAKSVTLQTLTRSLRPKPRPDPKTVSAQIGQTAPAKTQKKSLKGAVCGNAAIRGAVLAPIKSNVKGCGISDPVRVTEINGITLSPAATLNCGTAEALGKWIEKSVRPTFGARQVVQLQVAASYACRGRNNVKGARVSEHGRGNAIDIAGFTLENGKTLTVEKNYDKTLRKVHKGACGIFGTTLGPGSDGYHDNHLHLDIARYRSGSYCR